MVKVTDSLAEPTRGLAPSLSVIHKTWPAGFKKTAVM